MIRDRFPMRRVVRDVQGVQLVLPWSHRLPDYAALTPEYGQNLVALARGLGESGPVSVLDIGANVGDSALQILHAVDGSVLCVEADKAYLEFLHQNVDDDSRVQVVEALLSASEGGLTKAVRSGGTTRFVAGTGSDGMPSVSADDLRREFPEFDGLRLIKSDTDGYDVDLVPAAARAWASAKPVLFFEYDPYLTRIAGFEAGDVWERLEELGYRDVAVWDHSGTALGRTTTTEAAGLAASMLDENPRRPRSRTYWDVALAHSDDAAGVAALARLVPAALVAPAL
jgi:FkbM family methyltransferase